MKKCFLAICLALSFFMVSVQADEVDYNIPHYEGNLTIHNDNSADFTEKVTYQFDSSYNGQYVTLGTAGKLPDNFDINNKPQVEVSINGKVRKVSYQIEDLEDGYRLKVFNGGEAGDTVKVNVQWKLKNVLFMHKDVGELNWIPISDWDKTLEKVDFWISTDKKVALSRLWGHLGYLKTPPKIRQNNNRYHLTAFNVNKRLEFHGYWDRSYFNLPTNSKNNYKKKIEYQEKMIERHGFILSFLLRILLPSFFIIVTLFISIRVFLFRKKVNKYGQFPKEHHLYEAPEDLSPLELTQSIYSMSFKNFQDEEKKTHLISQEQLIQSILLDLIDRKVLNYDDNLLSLANLDRASDAEIDFIEFAFADSTSLKPDQLFSNYQFSYKETLRELKKQHKASDLQTQMRRRGSNALSRITRLTRLISKDNINSLRRKGISSPYRKMSSEESKELSRLKRFSYLSPLISFVVIIYTLFLNYFTYFCIYLLLFGVILLLNKIIFMMTRKISNGYIVTEDGASRVYKWTSFRNMLRDIKSFDRSELESIVLWNRILVYATLFGYADRVEKVLRVNQIDIPERFANIDSHQFAISVNQSSNHFSTITEDVSHASNFSVNSGGSSGGFSGGGGGGGGGAF